MTITLLGKPNCVACVATERELTKRGLEYNKLDVTEDQTAFDRALSLGHMAAPVVIVEETGENWSGFRLERISALAE